MILMGKTVISLWKEVISVYNKIKYRIEIIKQIFPHIRGVRKFFWLLGMLSVFSMFIGIVTPQIYKLFVDKIILGWQIDMLVVVIIGYIGLFIADTICSYLSNYASNRLINRLLIKIRHKILNNFLTMPMTDMERMDSGDLQMRIDDDTNRIAGFPAAQIINYIVSYISLIVIAVLLFTIEWRLALFSIVIIPFTFFIDHIVSKKEMYLHEFNRDNDQKMWSWMQNSIAGWKEIKALNLQKHEVRTFAGYLHNFARFYSHWIYYWTARALVIPKIKDDFLMQFALYFFGGLLIINGSLTISSLLVFMLYYKMLSDKVNTVSSLDADLQSGKPYYERVLHELKEDNKGKRKNLLPEKMVNTNTIMLEDVTFCYPDTKVNVLENFNLKIGAGERVAITGKSGAGKTTVGKLMMGFISAQSGIVSFSDINIDEIDQCYLYKQIGYVMQENLLFNLSIRENLLLAKPNATDAELNDACQKACILEFVNTLPEGYNTLIGERGVKLSGGQRQRIVLARLFLRDVNVFIFDEATSSLDQYSENIIHEAIKTIGRDKTIIVIAHRESSIALCDKRVHISEVPSLQSSQ